MSQDVTFRRKVIYIAVIAALLYPLFRIGQPASGQPDGQQNPGGVLAQLRAQYGLSQAELGEIDPASESMRLATLGMRGIAANVLWEKANDYKKKEDWDNLRVTLNQITKLQPNFISVWEFQAHNLSYNISVEFDDYRQRYHWVKKGIIFLMDGTRYNKDNPRLLHQIGWFLGQKLGRADEHVQFRQLFPADEDFHDQLNTGVSVDEGVGYDGRPDNWLVGRLWYLRAQLAVDTKGMPLRSKSPLIFNADPPMSLINYASDIEEEGILGEVARRAWAKGGESWAEYGKRAIPTSWGHNIRLGELAAVREEITRLQARLDALIGDARAQVREEKVAKLRPELRKALELAETELDESNYQQHLDAVAAVAVTHEEAAKRAPPTVRDRAVKLAARLRDQETLATRIGHYRGIINYEYWQTRCDAEQTETAVAAREFLYKARKFHDATELENACDMYEQAWRKWKTLFDQFPTLMDDVTADETVEAVKRYQRLLEQLDRKLPQDFVLREFVSRRNEEFQKYFQIPGPGAPGAKPAPGDKPVPAEKPAA